MFFFSFCVLCIKNHAHTQIYIYIYIYIYISMTDSVNVMAPQEAGNNTRNHFRFSAVDETRQRQLSQGIR